MEKLVLFATMSFMLIRKSSVLQIINLGNNVKGKLNM